MDKEIHAQAFLNSAVYYLQAANFIFAGRQQIEQGGREAMSPIYHLYMLSIELALKGFLRDRNLSTQRLKKIGHDLEKLFQMSESFGFAPSERNDVFNVVNLLNSSNGDHAFRYFSFRSRVIPEIDWASGVTNQVIVEILEKIPLDKSSGPAVKMDLFVGKPKSINRKQ